MTIAKILLVSILLSSIVYGNNNSQIDSLKNLLNASSNNSDISVIYNDLSIAFLDSSYDKAIDYAQKAIEHAETNQDKANAFYSLGEIYYYKDNLKKSSEYFNKSLELYRSEYAYQKVADCLTNIGINNEIQGDFDEAVLKYNESYECYEKADNKRGMAIALNNIGIVYNTRGDYEKGFEFFQRSLKIEEEIGNKEGIAESLTNIGLMQKKMGHPDKTIEYYKKSIEIKKEINDIDGMALTYSNLGSVYIEMKYLDSAFYYYKTALDYYLKLDNAEGLGLAYTNIASVYYEKENYNEALLYYLKAIEYRSKINHQRGLANTLNSIGNCYIKLNDPEKAKSYLLESHKISKDLAIREQLANNYLSFSDLYSMSGDYKNALEYFKLYKAERDTLLNENNHKQISDLNTKYETEKKEQQIIIQLADLEKKEAIIQKERILKYSLLIIGFFLVLLAVFIYNRYRYKNKINKLLAIKNNQLEELNSTKNKFFSIISHDLKNPFGTLVSVSEMLDEKYSSLSDDQKTTLVKTISKSAKITHNLLENLLHWSSTQTGKISFNPEKANINEILIQVVDILKPQAQEKKIDILVEKQCNIEVYADVNMLNTVLRNLISNAIKFTEINGQINARISKTEKNAVIEVEDNGIGLSQDDVTKLFRIDVDHRKIGKAKNKGTGLGLILCKEFVEMHDGNISVESEPCKGSIFKFSLPLFENL